jgi:hypothetical protein
MADKKNIQATIAVPTEFDQSQRELAANLIMDRIRANCANGKNRYGNSFPKYSDEYKASLDFQNGGKSSKVNLELTGDMLVSMELVSSKPGIIIIGYPASSEYAGQVEGNQIGSYGGEANSGKARPFLGLPQNQLDLIFAKVSEDTPTDVEKRSGVSSIIDSLIARFG